MRYMVRQKIFSIGDDFWITDEQGNRVFLVDGKAMSLRHKLELKDHSGAVQAVVHKKLVAIRDTMKVERDGKVIATVTKAAMSPLRHKSHIELADGAKWVASGNLLDHEFDITDSDKHIVARVSRTWFHIRDSYGVDVAPGEDEALILAVAVCLDRLHHDEEEEHRR